MFISFFFRVVQSASSKRLNSPSKQSTCVITETKVTTVTVTKCDNPPPAVVAALKHSAMFHHPEPNIPPSSMDTQKKSNKQKPSEKRNQFLELFTNDLKSAGRPHTAPAESKEAKSAAQFATNGSVRERKKDADKGKSVKKEKVSAKDTKNAVGGKKKASVNHVTGSKDTKSVTIGSVNPLKKDEKKSAKKEEVSTKVTINTNEDEKKADTTTDAQGTI